MAERNALSETVAGLGSAIYEKLRQSLERNLDGKFVAIHVQSGDYATGRSTADAMRAVRILHDDGPLFLRKIGSEPEYGLAARLSEGDMRSSGPHK